MPRFTILAHHAGRRPTREIVVAGRSIAAGPVHWDWLFDPDDNPSSPDSPRVWTWATDPVVIHGQDRPASFPEAEFAALRLPDHRRLYLDYCGEIGNDRGTVDPIVTGRYELCRQGAGELEFDLRLIQSSLFVVPDRVRLTLIQSDVGSDGGSPVWTVRSGRSSSDSSGGSVAIS